MAKRINGVPQCPNCGRRQSRVVLTCDALNGKFDTIGADIAKTVTTGGTQGRFMKSR